MTCFMTCDSGLTPREALLNCAEFCGRFVAPGVTVFYVSAQQPNYRVCDYI